MIDVSQFNAAFIETWGEAIHYIAVQGATTTAGSGRAITAVVDRQPPAPQPPAPGGVRPMMVVYVINSATTGISAAELDIGQDILMIPERVGGSESAFHIDRMVTQDEGLLALEVR